jgi:hypothetical protein
MISDDSIRKARGIVRLSPFLAGAACALFLPAMAQASGTTWTGNVTVNLTITVKSAVTSGETVYCGLDLRGTDNGGEDFTAHRTITATAKSSTTYTCSIQAPYNWTDQAVSDATLDITATYGGAIINSSLPVADQVAAQSTGTFTAAANITSGQSVTYATTVQVN